MGWSGGSELMQHVINEIERYVPEYDKRVVIYKRLIDVWCNEDCDTLDECTTRWRKKNSPAFTEAFDALFPDED